MLASCVGQLCGVVLVVAIETFVIRSGYSWVRVFTSQSSLVTEALFREDFNAG